MRFYGATALRLPWPETRDGYIPWAKFWQWYGCIPAEMAHERVSQTSAMGTAVGLVMGGKDSQAGKVFRDDLRAAFPDEG